MSVEISGSPVIPTDMNDVRVTGFAGILDVFRNADLRLGVKRGESPSPQSPSQTKKEEEDFPILPVLFGILGLGGGIFFALKK
jgi:hypothetical protein